MASILGQTWRINAITLRDPPQGSIRHNHTSSRWPRTQPALPPLRRILWGCTCSTGSFNAHIGTRAQASYHHIMPMLLKTFNPLKQFQLGA
eukprot:291014-Amphidinium_carterae.1